MLIALNVLFNVVLKSTILMCPFVPFLTEMIYENLKRVIDPKSKYFD
jgi:isoleucyl-tRNA synthetase